MTEYHFTCLQRAAVVAKQAMSFQIALTTTLSHSAVHALLGQQKYKVKEYVRPEMANCKVVKPAAVLAACCCSCDSHFLARCSVLLVVAIQTRRAAVIHAPAAAAAPKLVHARSGRCLLAGSANCRLPAVGKDAAG